MKQLSKKMLTAFVVATLVGACLHFLYHMFPNPITALLAPVNESLWEHLKILVWPYLVAALVLTKGGEKGRRAPWFLSLLLLCAAMLAFGYLYHILLGGAALAVDVAVYVLLMAAGFLLPAALRKAGESPLGRDVLTLAIMVLVATMTLFTFLPPDAALFLDLSRVNTFARIPC